MARHGADRVAVEALEERELVRRSLPRRHGAQHTMTPELMRDLSASLKPKTTNSYAPYYAQWRDYCQQRRAPPMPACPFRLASFLSSLSSDNKTVEPTRKRVCAINHYHSVAGFPPPCQHPFVQRIVRGIKRRLGSRGSPSEPITLQEIYVARASAVAAGETGLMYVADICAVMQEAQLRWDDIADIRLGDIIWSDSAVRLLIVDSKTDATKQGQFGTLSFSLATHSACQRLLQLIRQGISGFSKLSCRMRHTLLAGLERQRASLPYKEEQTSTASTLPSDILQAATDLSLPLANLPLLGTWPWMATPTSLLQSLSYNCFLSHLKRLFHGKPRVSTHSLRRGGTTEKIAAGIEPRLVQWLGRWKSAESFEGYVGARTNVVLAVEAVERTRGDPLGAQQRLEPSSSLRAPPALPAFRQQYIRSWPGLSHALRTGWPCSRTIQFSILPLVVQEKVVVGRTVAICVLVLIACDLSVPPCSFAR